MRLSKTLLTSLAAAVIAAAFASPAAAQQLPYGGWTGTMTPPGGEPITVSYEVGELDGALAIVMRAIMVQEVIPFHDIRVEGDALTFWWEPGSVSIAGSSGRRLEATRAPAPPRETAPPEGSRWCHRSAGRSR